MIINSILTLRRSGMRDNRCGGFDEDSPYSGYHESDAGSMVSIPLSVEISDGVTNHDRVGTFHRNRPAELLGENVK